MVLALGVSALVAVALISDVLAPRAYQSWARYRARRATAEQLSIGSVTLDPGRERRAEQTARELLRSCVGDEEWAMYRELGFIRVWGSGSVRRNGGAEHAYLIYAHRPIVAYEPQTRRLLGEYCVEFPDHTRPYGTSRLPDSDDVLAKWMALTGDERRLLDQANQHMPGRQIDAAQVTRDLWRLSRWEQARMRLAASTLDDPAQPRHA
jgi:hypothetical protein